MSIQDNWPFNTVVPTDDGATTDILQAIETELDRIDVETDELYEQRFLETATKRELQKLAGEVGVQRQTDESDERLRFRAQIAKAVTQSNGNIYEIAELFDILFGDDATRLTLSSTTQYPIVTVTVPSDMIESIPLTIGELEDSLTELVPAGDGIRIQTEDTFAFAGESSGAGFNEGTWK